MKKNQENSLRYRMKAFGIKYECKEWSPQEKEKQEQLIRMLEIKQKYKTVKIEDVLTATHLVGLGDKIADGLAESVKDKKKWSILGLIGSAGLYAILQKYELPNAIEIIGYAGVITSVLGNIFTYSTSHLAGKYFNRCLREKS